MDAKKAAELMERPLDSREFNNLASWLREVDGRERTCFLKEHFSNSASYRLATSVINKRDEAYEIVRFGLDSIHTANSQRTKAAVEFGIKKLGPKRTIAEVATRINSQPHVVDMALYWMPSMIEEGDLALPDLKELKRVALEADVIRPTRETRQTDGSTLYSDRYGP